MTEANGPLTREQRGFVALLGLPMVGVTLAVTVTAAYAPVLLEDLSGPALIGFLIGLEGLFALVVPPLVGAWSDRIDTGIGKRLPFLIVAAAVIAVSLALLPVVSGSLVLIAVMLAVFFLGYHLYTAPYWALFPDLVPDEIRGRSVGSMGFWRAIGMGMALAGGGIMLAAWEPLPFLLSATVLVGVTAAFVPRAAKLVRSRLESPSEGGGSPEGEAAHGGVIGETYRLLSRNARMRAVLAANALWEAAIGALRAFAVLYMTVGLGISLELTSAVLAGVALAALVAAPVAGSLADRWGELRLMRIGVWVFGLGLVLPVLSSSAFIALAAPPIAFAAVAVMTLPLSLVMGAMEGNGNHGVTAGAFAMSRGVGLLLGPLAAGLAITLMGPVFPATDGYAAAFLVASVAVLASLPLLSLIGRARDRTDAGGEIATP